MRTRVGQQVSNYRLTRLLGQGGFAEVYLGENIYLHKPAALKFLYGRLSEQDIEGFVREAQTMAALKHPHILQVYDFGQDGEQTPYIVMDYAPHGTLAQRHPRGSVVPLVQILTYIQQVGSALAYLHERKLIHRDIKPENMLLDEHDQLLLSDFGVVASAHRPESMQMQNISGTARYMAPEQFRGYPTPASDQYALATVVYEWLCGSSPFHGNSFVEMGMKHALDPVPTLRDRVPGLSIEVERIVLKALVKQETERFPRIQNFVQALEEAVAHEKPSANAQPAQIPNEQRQQHQPSPFSTETYEEASFPLMSAPHLYVGQRIGNYRLLRPIGHGKFAQVYLGEHLFLSKQAAIKFFYARLTNQEIQTFTREVKSIETLQHPHVVSVHDFGLLEGAEIPYIIMDHAPGGTLRQHHPRGTLVPLAQVVSYVQQVGSALAYLHDHTLLHLHVKPQNMLLDEDGQILLSDPLIAGIMQSSLPHNTISVAPKDAPDDGCYTAPEQASGDPTVASDQYALAIAAYEWLCGAPPFHDNDSIEIAAVHARKPIPPLRDHVPNLPGAVEEVIVKALAKDARQRYSHIQNFVAAFQRAAETK